ncbi:MAG: hypothetical protein JWR01_2405 [Subtercola sp.]|nr:hypothetical protein [Subtercola sp.]
MTATGTLVYADDLVLDSPYPVGSHTVTHREIVDFAAQWDPQAMHIDDEAAADGRYGEVIASGIHTMGIFQRLAVTNAYRGWDIIAGRRIGRMEFTKVVKPGAVLTGSVTITAVDHRSDHHSLVFKYGRLWDAEGDLVFSLEAEAYMGRPPGSTL